MQVPASARLHLKTAHSALTSDRTRRWAGLITSFLAGQGAVQLLNLVTGFFLLRWMSVESYAQFSVAFGFQTMLTWLVDLGAAGSIVALVGSRVDDKEVIGKYIRSARHFRLQLLFIAIPIAGIVFWVITSKHQWPGTLKVLLFSSIVGTLLFQGWTLFYSTPLLINQNLRAYYKPQVFGSSWRLAICLVLKFSSALFAWTMAWAGAVALLVQGLVYRKQARTLVVEPVKSDPALNKEMLRYIAPAMPWVIFTAFQGQISLFLIAWFGKTRNVAEIAALGRVGQLFLLLGMANAVVIAPYIARVPPKQLLRRYLQVSGFALLIASILCIAAFLFPQPLLWLLGPKYENLSGEIGWAVAGSCVGYLSSLLLLMHNARKWIYWWWSTTHIAVLLIAQIACLFTLNLASTRGVLYFSLIINLTALIVLVMVGIYGFAYGPPKRLRNMEVATSLEG
jgi:O-antigen/teichoic acid export membrane protein